MVADAAPGAQDRPRASAQQLRERVSRHRGQPAHEPGLPDVVIARTTDRVGAAIDRFQEFGISQMPVSQDAEGDSVSGIVGSIGERGLLDRLYRNPEIAYRTVGEVMDRPLPTVPIDASLDEAFRLLAGDATAVLAVRDRRPAGIVTKLDVLEFLAHRAD